MIWTILAAFTGLAAGFALGALRGIKQRDYLRDLLSGAHAKIYDLETQLEERASLIAPFDRDGDGRPGGSKKGVQKQPNRTASDARSSARPETGRSA